MDAWPFADPPNFGVFTTVAVLELGAPILSVSHDPEDGAWQFHASGEALVDDGRLVCLDHIVACDPTIRELADLPLGWAAERASREAPWQRFPSVPEPDEAEDAPPAP